MGAETNGLCRGAREDMISHALWRLGFDVSPEKHFATDQEVEIKVRRRQRKLQNSLSND